MGWEVTNMLLDTLRQIAMDCEKCEKFTVDERGVEEIVWGATHALKGAELLRILEETEQWSIATSSYLKNVRDPKTGCQPDNLRYLLRSVVVNEILLPIALRTFMDVSGVMDPDKAEQFLKESPLAVNLRYRPMFG